MTQSNLSGSPFPRGHFFPAELRQKMSDDLHLTGKADRTRNGYLRAVRQLSDLLLFPADGRNHSLAKKGVSQAANPMSETSAQGAMKQITQEMNLGKKVSIHTLRHSFATHLLWRGTDIRTIQRLLGLSAFKTTEIYTHVLNPKESRVVSPLDRLSDCT